MDLERSPETKESQRGGQASGMSEKEPRAAAAEGPRRGGAGARDEGWRERGGAVLLAEGQVRGGGWGRVLTPPRGPGLPRRPRQGHRAGRTRPVDAGPVSPMGCGVYRRPHGLPHV